MTFVAMPGVAASLFFIRLCLPGETQTYTERQLAQLEHENRRRR